MGIINAQTKVNNINCASFWACFQTKNPKLSKLNIVTTLIVHLSELVFKPKTQTIKTEYLSTKSYLIYLKLDCFNTWKEKIATCIDLKNAEKNQIVKLARNKNVSIGHGCPLTLPFSMFSGPWNWGQNFNLALN